MRSFLVHRFAVTLPRTLKLLQGGWDVSGALKTLATCRMAGAIRISPYRHGRLTGNYLPGWMASAPFGCQVLSFVGGDVPPTLLVR